MAIGVFGGTFDPVHMGHLRIAEEVREAFSLERVYFVPARVQPLKVAAGCAESGHRLHMLKMAVRGNGFFRASTVEMRRGGISYSVDTVKHFRARFGDVFFIVGMDAFADIGFWKDYGEMFALADFVVMTRPGHALSGLPGAISGEARRVDDSTYEHESGRKIYFHSITQLDISSTRIRELAGEGRSIKYLVPDAVERYIIRRGLYRN